MQTEFIFSDKWCDIVFEKRNHAYGAYVLRKKQPDTLITGWFTTFLAFALLFSGFIYLNNKAMEKIAVKVFPKTDPVFEYNYEKEKSAADPVKKMEPLKNTAKTTGMFVASDSTEKDADTLVTTPIVNNNGPTGNSKSDTLTTADSPGGFSSGGGKAKDIPLIMSEIMPEFPGGEIAMLAFMRRNVDYPDEYLRMGKSATVYIQFVIDTNGIVTQIETLRGEKGYPQFEESAIAAAGKMPHWKPGIQGGMKVPVLYKLPVSFSTK